MRRERLMSAIDRNCPLNDVAVPGARISGYLRKPPLNEQTALMIKARAYRRMGQILQSYRSVGGRLSKAWGDIGGIQKSRGEPTNLVSVSILG